MYNNFFTIFLLYAAIFFIQQVPEQRLYWIKFLVIRIFLALHHILLRDIFISSLLLIRIKLKPAGGNKEN